MKTFDESEEDGQMERKGMDVDAGWRSMNLVDVLKKFLGVQRRRAEAYSKLRRGFSEYMVSSGELAYQKLCAEITAEFSDCSQKVLEMESLLANSDLCRADLAAILKVVQEREKQKLQMTVQIQMLKKAGRPSEQPVSHESCPRGVSDGHECIHIRQLTEADGVEDAEADAAYDEALNNAIRGVQEAVTCINDLLEDVRYEIEALEAHQLEEELLERSAAAVKIS
ncbi:DNA repair REX1-B protein [Wolffia australiana]